MRIPDIRRRAAIAILLGKRLTEGGPDLVIDTDKILAETRQQPPRAGRWYEGDVTVVNETDARRTFVVDDLLKTRGDGRSLSQDDTDQLIVVEVHHAILPVSMDVMQALWRSLPWPKLTNPDIWLAAAQRGGISSQPLARAVAMALWGDRDAGISREAYDAKSAGL
jgi:hypothetical protein